MESFVSQLSSYLEIGSILAYPAAFLGGLFVSFTPCVYPVIPIQLGFIGANTINRNDTTLPPSQFDRRGFLLSLTFVFGMSLVFGLLGIIASLTGSLLGSWSENPWIYLLFANVIIFFGLSMLDVFSIQLPQSFSTWNPDKKSNPYIASLLVGAASGLIIGPCTAPALGVTLTYVGSRGDVFFGATVLVAFALGMGTLMIVIGAFSGLFLSLPRSGKWMVRVKKGFGILMIIGAQFLLIEAGKRFL